MTGHEEAYWNPLVPELTVRDLQVSLAFYLAAGFVVRFRRDGPPFAYIELGQAQMMLEQQEIDGAYAYPLDRPLGRGISLQVEVTDVAATRKALISSGFVPCLDPTDTWYATSPTWEEVQREFWVKDPDGYLIRFAQPLGGRSIPPGRGSPT